MCVRPFWSAILGGTAALLKGMGVWLNGSMAPSMRFWVLSPALKRKESLLKSHPSQLLQKKSRRATVACRQVPEEEDLY